MSGNVARGRVTGRKSGGDKNGRTCSSRVAREFPLPDTRSAQPVIHGIVYEVLLSSGHWHCSLELAGSDRTGYRTVQYYIGGRT